MKKHLHWKNYFKLWHWQIQKRWVNEMYWHGDFSGHAWSEGGWEYRIITVKEVTFLK